MAPSDLLLATYGTLMRPFGASDSTEFLSFEARCRFRGVLYDLGAFPGAVRGDGEVVGELHRVRDAGAWAALDRYEGYDEERPSASLFVRRRVELEVPAGQVAWVYWYNGPTEPHDRVPSGDWAAYVGVEGGRELGSAGR